MLVWIGHPDKIAGGVTLTVLERGDKTFKATFEDGVNIRTVNGTIRGREIKWLARDVEVLKGSAGYNFTGQITGSHLLLRSLWSGRYFKKPFSPATIELALNFNWRSNLDAMGRAVYFPVAGKGTR